MYKNDENRWLGITDHLVIDVIDTFVLDFGYDKKTVEKIFYKKHKLNDFDDLTNKEVIEIEDEVKNALGITESKKSSRKSIKESIGDGIKITNKNFEELPSWIFEDNKILKTMYEIVNTATRKNFDVVYFGDVLSGEIYIVNDDIQFIISNAGVNKDSPFCNIVVKNIEKVNEVYDYIARLPYASVYKKTDEIDEFIPNKYLKDVLDKILNFLYYWK